jgi:hypothetical protein
MLAGVGVHKRLPGLLLELALFEQLREETAYELVVPSIRVVEGVSLNVCQLQRFTNSIGIAIRQHLRCLSGFGGGRHDIRLVVVGERDVERLDTSQPYVARKYIGVQVRASQVADMQIAIGRGWRGGNDDRFHVLFYLRFDRQAASGAPHQMVKNSSAVVDDVFCRLC